MDTKLVLLALVVVLASVDALPANRDKRSFSFSVDWDSVQQKFANARARLEELEASARAAIAEAVDGIQSHVDTAGAVLETVRDQVGDHVDTAGTVFETVRDRVGDHVDRARQVISDLTRSTD